MLAWIATIGAGYAGKEGQSAKAFCVVIQGDGELLGYLGLLELYLMKKYMVL
jgi:hypothetical protein